MPSLPRRCGGVPSFVRLFIAQIHQEALVRYTAIQMQCKELHRRLMCMGRRVGQRLPTLTLADVVLEYGPKRGVTVGTLLASACVVLVALLITS